jgi:hypothetical protein
MAHVQLTRLWTDDDGMVQVALAATNGAQLVTQDFYSYPNDFESFGKALEEFPKSANAEARFEYGNDNPKMHAQVLIRAFVLNGRGHSAIEIKTNNNRESPERSIAHFFIPCEPATINRFGKELRAWSATMATPLLVEWKDA